MLITAFAILGAAVLVGSLLGILYLRAQNSVAPPWPLAALHGLLAIGGFGCLIVSLRGSPRGLETGTASFGIIAAGLIVLAILAGSVMLGTHLLAKRTSGMLIGVHATLAVAGFVVLSAYVFAG